MVASRARVWRVEAFGREGAYGGFFEEPYVVRRDGLVLEGVVWLSRVSFDLLQGDGGNEDFICWYFSDCCLGIVFNGVV